MYMGTYFEIVISSIHTLNLGVLSNNFNQYLYLGEALSLGIALFSIPFALIFIPVL